MFIAALFIITKKWKPPDEWHKCIPIQWNILFSHLKGNEVLKIHDKKIILSEKG